MKKKIISSILFLLIFCLEVNAQISQAEYFWDTDPGEGNGVPLQSKDGNFDESLEELVGAGVDLPSTSGLHLLHVRVKVWRSLGRSVENVGISRKCR